MRVFVPAFGAVPEAGVEAGARRKEFWRSHPPSEGWLLFAIQKVTFKIFSFPK